MSCLQLARAALYLAFDGNDPLTGDAVTTPSRSRRINSLMLTSGHYDVSGDFAFRVGLPGKSAANGAILAIVPGIGAVCVWSPGPRRRRHRIAGNRIVAVEGKIERRPGELHAAHLDRRLAEIEREHRLGIVDEVAEGADEMGEAPVEGAGLGFRHGMARIDR